MSVTLFDEIYDMSISEKLKTDNSIFEKIVEKYKKSNSLEMMKQRLQMIYQSLYAWCKKPPLRQA